jgi:hypothetical protein
MAGRDVTSAYLVASCFVKSAVPTFTIVPRGWGLGSLSSCGLPVASGGGAGAANGAGFSVQTPYTRPPYAASPV